MPTEIRVTVVNLNTGGRFVLVKQVNKEVRKDGRWISYAPKIRRVRRKKHEKRK